MGLPELSRSRDERRDDARIDERVDRRRAKRRRRVQAVRASRWRKPQRMEVPRPRCHSGFSTTTAGVPRNSVSMRVAGVSGYDDNARATRFDARRGQRAAPGSRLETTEVVSAGRISRSRRPRELWRRRCAFLGLHSVPARERDSIRGWAPLRSRNDSPLASAKTDWISETMASAISSGVSAPRSKPAGANSSESIETPASRRALTNWSRRFRGPSRPT